MTAGKNIHKIDGVRWYHQVGMGLSTSITAGLIVAWLTTRWLRSEVEAATSPPRYRVMGSPVSVITPTLQEENYLPQLLQTIRNQTYFPIEIVVADSSPSPSREETEEICRAFEAQYVFVPQLNVAQARNEGALASTGEILVFTDADCRFTANYIESAVGALENGYVLAHGSDPVVDGGIIAPLTVIARSLVKPTHWTSGRGIAIRRSVFLDIGMYNVDLDPTLGYREDLDLGFRVAAQYGNNKIKYFTKPMIAESSRRMMFLGAASWTKARGVRNGKMIPV